MPTTRTSRKRALENGKDAEPLEALQDTPKRRPSQRPKKAAKPTKRPGKKMAPSTVSESSEQVAPLSGTEPLPEENASSVKPAPGITITEENDDEPVEELHGQEKKRKIAQEEDESSEENDASVDKVIDQEASSENEIPAVVDESEYATTICCPCPESEDENQEKEVINKEHITQADTPVEVALEKDGSEAPVQEETEEEPAEDKLIEEKPMEDEQVDVGPTEKEPTQEKPTEEKPTEEKSTEEKPAEEKPTEGKSNGKPADLPLYSPTSGHWDESGILHESGSEGSDMLEYITGDSDDDIEVTLDNTKAKTEHSELPTGGLHSPKKAQADSVPKIVIDDGFVDEVDSDDEESLYSTGTKPSTSGNGYHTDEEAEEKPAPPVETYKRPGFRPARNSASPTGTQDSSPVPNSSSPPHRTTSGLSLPGLHPEKKGSSFLDNLLGSVSFGKSTPANNGTESPAAVGEQQPVEADSYVEEDKISKNSHHNGSNGLAQTESQDFVKALPADSSKETDSLGELLRGELLHGELLQAAPKAPTAPMNGLRGSTASAYSESDYSEDEE